MAGIGRVTVSNIAAVGDVTQTRQYKITVVFDIAFNYSGYNAGGASYSIACAGQTQGGTATFNIANGNGNYVWGNIATKTFVVTLDASEGTKVISISATINTGINPATITAKGSCTLTNKYAVTFNPNGGELKKPGGNLNNGTNTNSVTVTYSLSSCWAMSGDIPTRTGYTFNGWYTSPSGGTQVYDATGHCTNEGTYWSDQKWVYKGNVTLYAQWTAISYTNTISHWLSGFKNGEGNNSDGSAFKLGETNFSAAYGSRFGMGSSRKIAIPNGCELAGVFGTSSISGYWGSYDIGVSVDQVIGGMSFEYYYDPISYSIEYDLNGGKNNSANPSIYNVLYGVSLKEPTRTGYTFEGWHIDNTKVAGINAGCNASFASASDMYAKLASRTTGNLTLKAKWTANTFAVSYNANGGSNAPSVQTKIYGVDLTLSKDVPTRKGYEFLYWNTRSDGAGITYLPGVTYTSNQSVTLYAIWKRLGNARVRVGEKYIRGQVRLKLSGTYRKGQVRVRVNGVYRKGE